MAFGNGAGLVDTDKKEGQTLLPAALQRGETMGDLFDAGAKLPGQLLKIMSQILRGGQKGAIGHEARPCIVIGQTQFGDVAGSR